MRVVAIRVLIEATNHVDLLIVFQMELAHFVAFELIFAIRPHEIWHTVVRQVTIHVHCLNYGRVCTNLHVEDLEILIYEPFDFARSFE